MKYCSNCGEQSSNNARFCVKCGYEINSPVTPPPPINTTSSGDTFRNPGQMPTTYLWQSIVVTILCCWPLGIPAIVYASRVDNLFYKGDIEGAERASRYAKNFSIWSLVAGILAGLAYLSYSFLLLGGLAALDGIY